MLVTLTQWYDDEQVTERNEFIKWDGGGVNCRVCLFRSPWKKKLNQGMTQYCTRDVLLIFQHHNKHFKKNQAITC